MTTAVSKSSRNWRVADVVVVVRCCRRRDVPGLVPGHRRGFAATKAVYTPLTGLIAGGWMIPAILGMLLRSLPLTRWSDE